MPMWGTSWRQRLKLAPLYAAMLAAERLPIRTPAPAQRNPWAPGVSVVIPDRDAPQMLAGTLQALSVALAEVAEPVQIVVVANGAAPRVYAEVAARFPAVEWLYSDAPLGFAGAIERGLARVRHDATYLLNNDMTLDPGALVEVLRWRAPEVFAIASQIMQRSANGRREETGFVDWYVDRDGAHLYHAPVPAATDPVEHLCASGGAALFRTAPLIEYVRASRCYDPFYWEDAEWGVRAWRDGLRVLYAPRSLATHAHRATTARFYASEEIDRIVLRNRRLFDARHGVSGFGAAWLMERICELPYESQRELARFAQARAVFHERRAARHAPLPSAPPRLSTPDATTTTLTSSYSFRLRVPGTGTPARPRLLVVTPFAVFPPRHGGARRVAELIRGLKPRFDIALVSDEAALYDARSFANCDGLCAVRLVQRVERARDDGDSPLAARMRTHCHEALVAAVADTVRDFRPDLVAIEYAELAPLVAHRTAGARWVLDLHDAYGPADFADAADARDFARDLAAYDALVVCSADDAALVAHPQVVCIANGSGALARSYMPSQSLQVLFVGPFRYAANRDGIVAFLDLAWPAIRARVPGATLLILAGDEHSAYTQADARFALPGVTVSGHRDDVPDLISASALTINPQVGIRGSAVKLIESVAAGRVCVSTQAGARGFATGSLAALVTVEGVAAMAEPVAALLADTPRRHALERAEPGALDAYSWAASATRLQALYDSLIDKPAR